MSVSQIISLVLFLAPLIDKASDGGPPIPFRFTKRKGDRRLVVAGLISWEGEEDEGVVWRAE